MRDPVPVPVPVLRRLARDQWVRLHGTPRVTVLIGGERAAVIWNQWLAVSGTAGTLLRGELDDQLPAAVTRAASEPAHPIAVLAEAGAAARWRSGRRDRLAAMADEGWLEVPEAGPGEAGAALAVAPGAGSTSGPAGTAVVEGAPVGSGAWAPGADSTSGPAGALVVETPLKPGMQGAGREPGASRTSESGTAASPVAGGDRVAAAAAVLDARSVAEATLYEALEAVPATAGRFTLNASLSVRFGGGAAEIDLLSRSDRIAIEIDGVHHFLDPDRYRRDRRKDLLLQTQGFVVVRVLAEDVVRDVRAAMSAVVQALAYRRGEAG